MRLDEILKRRLAEASGEKLHRGAAPSGAASRLHRDIFLYMAPRQPADQFAQCGTCELFVPDGVCAILGPKVPVSADMSCGSYVWGTPHAQRVREAATAEEVGLVQRPVRCENCISFMDGKCKLYEALNKKMPDVFDLDVNVEPQACCNAQSPK